MISRSDIGGNGERLRRGPFSHVLTAALYEITLSYRLVRGDVTPKGSGSQVGWNEQLCEESRQRIQLKLNEIYSTPRIHCSSVARGHNVASTADGSRDQQR